MQAWGRTGSIDTMGRILAANRQDNCMTPSFPPTSESRHQQIQSWLQGVAASPLLALEPAAADASARRYWRAQFGDGTRIVMDAPAEGFDYDQFLGQHARLVAAGAPVPQLFAHDAQQGFALLEDLGQTTLTQQLTPESAQSWYLQAIDLLVELQAKVAPAGLPPYDAEFLRRELEICREWYFGRQLGVDLQDEALETWERSCALIVLRNLAQPNVYVHRDFHSRNLMVIDGAYPANPGIIDFQDAVYGPITYDVVSLLRDAYIEWPEDVQIDWLARYWEMARAAGLSVPAQFDVFYRDFEYMGLQRHLKILGIFARLYHRDGKSGYLKDLPLVLKYTRQVAARYREFGHLLLLLDQVAEQAGEAGQTTQVGYTF